VVVKRDDDNWNELIPKLDIPTEIVDFMNHTVTPDDIIETSYMPDIDYEKMPYKELVKTAKEKGVFKIGMKRDDLIREIKQTK